MNQIVNFKELVEKENVLHLMNGNATKIVDDETTVWSVFDWESDEIYLLVDNEVNDLEPLIDIEFYKMVKAIRGEIHHY